LTERESTSRGSGGQREREEQDPRQAGKPDAGLDPRTPES